MSIYYNFGANMNSEMTDSIDDKEIVEKLKLIHEMEYEELELNIKSFIKTPTIFNQHLKEFQLTPEEYIRILARAFPNIWNHYLIKYVKKTYLNDSNI